LISNYSGCQSWHLII